MKVGGGSRPIRTGRGWFLMYHGFETRETVGVYRTFWALLDLEDPSHRPFSDRVILSADQGPFFGIMLTGKT